MCVKVTKTKSWTIFLEIYILSYNYMTMCPNYSYYWHYLILQVGLQFWQPQVITFPVDDSVRLLEICDITIGSTNTAF